MFELLTHVRDSEIKIGSIVFFKKKTMWKIEIRSNVFPHRLRYNFNGIKFYEDRGIESFGKMGDEAPVNI